MGIGSIFGQTVAVTMSPSSANRYSGQTQQFNAPVSGSANTAVTWSITPPGTGSVSASGLYTTPAAIPTAQSVTITATSAADPTKSASAVVSLSPLTISISPASSNRFAGQTQQVNATIQKSTNTNVTWSISSAGTGSISANGLYTSQVPCLLQLW